MLGVSHTLTVLLEGKEEIMVANVADLAVLVWPHMQTLCPDNASCTHCFCASVSFILHIIKGNEVVPPQWPADSAETHAPLQLY